MREKFTNWLYALEENLHPNALIEKATFNSELCHYSDELNSYTKQFRMSFTKLVGRSKSEAKAHILYLTVVSDTIYNYMVKMAPLWNGHAFSTQINLVYKQTLLLLESLIEFCCRFVKPSLFHLPLTAFSIQNTKMELKKNLTDLQKIIPESDINPTLRNIVFTGLRLLIEKEKLNHLNVEYALIILVELKKLRPLTTVEVENLLYCYDFNFPSLYLYWTECCNRQIIETSSLHRQIELIIGFEDRINGLPPRTALRWMPEDVSIREQLRVFLKEKKAYLNQRMELRRSEIEDHKLTEDNDRMEVNVPVTQLGLLVRLFIERGILPKEDVGRTFAHYARHYRTPKTSFISAESLQKKSTNIEYSTANKVKGHLIGMVNWLNEHHNTNRDKERTS